jgi:hypothetical protein
MTEHVHAELRRSGGFAGRSVHVRVDSARMQPAQAARLVHLVSSIDFAALPAGHGPMPPGADLVRYDLTLQRGRRHWQGTVYDPAPRQLQPLLQFLSTTRSTP